MNQSLRSGRTCTAVVVSRTIAKHRHARTTCHKYTSVTLSSASSSSNSYTVQHDYRIQQKFMDILFSTNTTIASTDRTEITENEKKNYNKY
jgi:uncharacterized protein YpuA (DUF1002 family)